MNYNDIIEKNIKIINSEISEVKSGIQEIKSNKMPETLFQGELKTLLKIKEKLYFYKSHFSPDELEKLDRDIQTRLTLVDYINKLVGYFDEHAFLDAKETILSRSVFEATQEIAESINKKLEMTNNFIFEDIKFTVINFCFILAYYEDETLDGTKVFV